MKKPVLKKILVFSFAVVLFLVSYSCNKQKLSSLKDENSSSAVNSAATRYANPFKQTVGAPIGTELGKAWIDNFNKSNGGAGRSYIIQGKDLQAILSDSSCVGICLYFALDDAHQPHILPVGVNEDGMLMKSAFIHTQLGKIDWDTAQKWIANDPGEIDARFFGRNTFNRLFSDPSCRAIQAIYALDDHKNQLLILTNAAVKYSQITKANVNAIQMEDASAVCPPVCAMVAPESNQ